jgi:rare lipoprotein A
VTVARGARATLVATACALLVAACGSAPKRPGGYYKDDGPGDSPPRNVEAIPDATPKAEPLHRSANSPYTVFGRHYVPATAVRPFKERGTASWYGKRFHGQPTSSGERYDMYKMTAAHPTLPIPSYARVTNLKNGRSVIVRINDRGPFHSGRIIDLSYAAAAKLGYVNAGSAPVEVEAVLPAP